MVFCKSTINPVKRNYPKPESQAKRQPLSFLSLPEHHLTSSLLAQSELEGNETFGGPTIDGEVDAVGVHVLL